MCLTRLSLWGTRQPWGFLGPRSADQLQLACGHYREKGVLRMPKLRPGCWRGALRLHRYGVAAGLVVGLIQPVGATGLVSGDARVSQEMFLEELAAMPIEHRQRILANPQEANRLVDDLYRKQKYLAEAERRNIQADPQVRATLAAAHARILIGALFERVRAELSLSIPDLEPLAQEYYTAHQDEFFTPEQVHVRHILLKLSGSEAEQAAIRREAEDILAAARRGEDFAELARTHSADERSANLGGDLGWVAKGKMVKEFESAAFALAAPGDLSEVVKTRYGLHIIRLEARKGAEPKPFEAVRVAILDKLRNQYLNEHVEQWKHSLSDHKGADAYPDAIRQAFESARAQYGMPPYPAVVGTDSPPSSVGWAERREAQHP